MMIIRGHFFYQQHNKSIITVVACIHPGNYFYFGGRLMKHPVEIEESYNLFLKEYPDVLTTKDLQHILSVSSKTVFKLLHSSQIKSIKVGRNFRIPKIYLLQYLGLVPDEAL